MPHALKDNFARFFRRLNPARTWREIARSQFLTLKEYLEGHADLEEFKPAVFLQGSFGRRTAIYDINDLDVIVLSKGLRYSGTGRAPWSRNKVFKAIEGALKKSRRYKKKIDRSFEKSMCIKLKTSIPMDILPVLQATRFTDTRREPFYLWRPETERWEVGFARAHQAQLTAKNQATIRGRSTAKFIPMIKVMKHLRGLWGAPAVSFHLECLLHALPDKLFCGPPHEFIPLVLA